MNRSRDPVTLSIRGMTARFNEMCKRGRGGRNGAEALVGKAPQIRFHQPCWSREADGAAAGGHRRSPPAIPRRVGLSPARLFRLIYRLFQGPLISISAA